MSANPLQRPPRRAATTSRAASSPRRTRQRPSERRALAVGIGVSIGLHLLLLLISRWVLVSGDPSQAVAPPGEPGPAPGMRAIELAIVEGEPTPPQPPEDPMRALPVPPRPIDPVRPDEPPAVEVPPDARPGELPPAVERLEPRLWEPRLWTRRGLQPDIPLSAEDEVRLRVYGRLEALNDSLVALTESARRSMDWTYKTDDGQRWGISSEGIHLGSITLPAPNFAPPPGRRQEIDRLVRDWHELARQAELAGIREDFDARVRAIRERRDAERRQTTDSGSGINR